MIFAEERIFSRLGEEETLSAVCAADSAPESPQRAVGCAGQVSGKLHGIVVFPGADSTAGSKQRCVAMCLK